MTSFGTTASSAARTSAVPQRRSRRTARAPSPEKAVIRDDALRPSFRRSAGPDRTRKRRARQESTPLGHQSTQVGPRQRSPVVDQAATASGRSEPAASSPSRSSTVVPVPLRGIRLGSIPHGAAEGRRRRLRRSPVQAGHLSIRCHFCRLFHLAKSWHNFYIDINVFFGPSGPCRPRRSHRPFAAALRALAREPSGEPRGGRVARAQHRRPHGRDAAPHGRPLRGGMGSLGLAGSLRWPRGHHHAPGRHVGRPGPARRRQHGRLRASRGPRTHPPRHGPTRILRAGVPGFPRWHRDVGAGLFRARRWF